MDLQDYDSTMIFILIGGIVLGSSAVYLTMGASFSNPFSPQEVSIQELELNPENYEGENVTISGVTEEAGWGQYFEVADRIGYSIGVMCDQVPSDSFESGLEVTVTGEVVNRSKDSDSETTEEKDEGSESAGYYYPDSVTSSSTSPEYIIECTEPVQ